jgi:hypothetical protein
MRSALTALAVSVCFLAACGGGGGGSATAIPGQHAASYAASFTVSIPLASASARQRRPAYLSPATRSLAIAVDYAGGASATTIADLSITSPDCTASTSTLTCTVAVAVSDGAQTFVVRAYDGADGNGSLLGVTTLAVPPANGAATVAVTLVLDGVVQSVDLALQGGTLAAGVAGTRTVIVTARDAAGAIIVAPGNYAVPIAITSSVTALNVSPTSIAAPGGVLTAVYDGTNGAAPIITATSGTVSAALNVFTGTLTTPSPAPAPTSTASAAVPSPGPTATLVFTIGARPGVQP